MAEDKKFPRMILCVCTGKCPGFSKMDIWDFVNIARNELSVEFAFIHPQLCTEDGDRFFHDFLKKGERYLVAGCAPAMQYKLFKDSFINAGMDVKADLIPLDVRDKTTKEAIDLIKDALAKNNFTGKPGEDLE
jgi:heterodisulfide reductase subunit A-like polyferredoxin